jgi:hypothetical protein
MPSREWCTDATNCAGLKQWIHHIGWQLIQCHGKPLLQNINKDHHDIPKLFFSVIKTWPAKLWNYEKKTQENTPGCWNGQKFFE